LLKITSNNNDRTSLAPATTHTIHPGRMSDMEFPAELALVCADLSLMAITAVKHFYRHHCANNRRVANLPVALLPTQPALTGHYCLAWFCVVSHRQRI
jgi:hypothetical protein